MRLRDLARQLVAVDERSADVTGSLRVVIADDRYLVREGVRHALERSDQIGAVAVVGDAPELESVVDEYVSSIFSKLGLFDEPDIHRRVAAVLTYLDDHARAEPL